MGIGMWELLILLLIVVLLFGTKKLRNIGGDLGGAIRNFRNSMKEGEEGTAAPSKPEDAGKLGSKGSVIEGQATREKDKA